MFSDITALKRAETALRLDEERLEVLLALHTMTDASEHALTHFAMEAAVRLTRSTIGYVAFVNEDETVMTMYAWSQEAMRECRTAERPVVYPVATTGLWGEAIRQRRTIITNDYGAPHPWKKGTPEGHVPLSRHLNVPTFDGERIVIVAGVGNKPTDYGEDDVRQLSLLMQGLWSLLRRKRTEEALRERDVRLQNQNAAVLGLVSRGTLFQAELQQTLAEITEAGAALIGTERVSVWLYSEDYADLRCLDLYRRSVGQHTRGETLRSAEFPSYTGCFRKGEVIAAVDVSTDPRTREIPAAYFRELGIRSLLDAPVWRNERLGGVLSFEQVGEQRIWTLEDERLAAHLAALLSFCCEAHERKQAQAALQQSQSQLANAVKIAKLGHWDWEVESGLFTFTDSFYDILHTTARDVGGYQLSVADYTRRFVHPEDAPLVAEENRKALETDDPQFTRQLEHRILYADGGTGYLAVRLLIVKNGQGKTVRTYGVSQDITERKRAEEKMAAQLRELERWFEATLGREKRILELKEQVNALRIQAGQSILYPSALGETLERQDPDPQAR